MWTKKYLNVVYKLRFLFCAVLDFPTLNYIFKKNAMGNLFSQILEILNFKLFKSVNSVYIWGFVCLVWCKNADALFIMSVMILVLCVKILFYQRFLKSDCLSLSFDFRLGQSCHSITSFSWKKSIFNLTQMITNVIEPK